MTPITCSLVEPIVGAGNTLLALLTQVLGPIGLSVILTPISNFLGLIRGLAGCP